MYVGVQFCDVMYLASRRLSGLPRQPLMGGSPWTLFGATLDSMFADESVARVVRSHQHAKQGAIS